MPRLFSSPPPWKKRHCSHMGNPNLDCQWVPALWTHAWDPIGIAFRALRRYVQCRVVVSGSWTIIGHDKTCQVSRSYDLAVYKVCITSPKPSLAPTHSSLLHSVRASERIARNDTAREAWLVLATLQCSNAEYHRLKYMQPEEMPSSLHSVQ